MLFRVFFVVCTFILMQGCSPEHNWREVAVPEVRAMLPGKPAAMTRDVNLEGVKLKLTMQGARAGNQSYTVAYGQLPAGANEAAALASMKKAMLRNIGANDSKDAAMPVPLIDATGAAKGSLPSQWVRAAGQVTLDGKPRAVVMQARFAAFQGRVVQAVVMGDAANEEHAKIFLDSLRVVTP
jgi:hypothetical protein